MSGYDNWDYNFSTKRVKHDFGGSPENPKADKTEWKTMQYNRTKKLSELSKPYSWNISKDLLI